MTENKFKLMYKFKYKIWDQSYRSADIDVGRLKELLKINKMSPEPICWLYVKF